MFTIREDSQTLISFASWPFITKGPQGFQYKAINQGAFSRRSYKALLPGALVPFQGTPSLLEGDIYVIRFCGGTLSLARTFFTELC